MRTWETCAISAKHSRSCGGHDGCKGLSLPLSLSLEPPLQLSLSFSSCSLCTLTLSLLLSQCACTLSLLLLWSVSKGPNHQMNAERRCMLSCLLVSLHEAACKKWETWGRGEKKAGLPQREGGEETVEWEEADEQKSKRGGVQCRERRSRWKDGSHLQTFYPHHNQCTTDIHKFVTTLWSQKSLLSV